VAANQVVVVGMRQNPFPRRRASCSMDAGLAYKYIEYREATSASGAGASREDVDRVAAFTMVFVKACS